MQVIDATPSYLYYPEVLHRIQRAYEGMNLKFIVLLRDPVDRAFSMYRRLFTLIPFRLTTDALSLVDANKAGDCA